MNVLSNLGLYHQGGRWMKAALSPAMSPAMYFLDFYVYPAIIALCLAAAFVHATPVQSLQYAALVALGYGIWTLAEYVAHRFVFHHVAGFRGLHEAHHAAPHELIGTPTIFSVAVYAAVYLPIAFIIGEKPAAAWMAGLLAGYVSYLTAHYAVHHFGSGGYRLMKRLKRQHALHHHVSQQRNFGVTTAFWDKVFGTGAE